jgi:hypothetical protein
MIKHSHAKKIVIVLTQDAGSDAEYQSRRKLSAGEAGSSLQGANPSNRRTGFRYNTIACA